MSKFIDLLRQKCDTCSTPVIPLSISGVYLAGGQVILHECPKCGYIRKHGIKTPSVRRRKKPKSFSYGRLSQLIVTASRN